MHTRVRDTDRELQEVKGQRSKFSQEHGNQQKILISGVTYSDQSDLSLRSVVPVLSNSNGADMKPRINRNVLSTTNGGK